MITDPVLLTEVPDGTLDDMMCQLAEYVGAPVDQELMAAANDEGEVMVPEGTTYEVLYKDQFSGGIIASQEISVVGVALPQKSSFLIPAGYSYKTHEKSGVLTITVTCVADADPRTVDYAMRAISELPSQLTKPHYISYAEGTGGSKERLAARIVSAVNTMRHLLGLAEIKGAVTSLPASAHNIDVVASALDFSLPPEALGDFTARILLTYNDALLSAFAQPKASIVNCDVSVIETSKTSVKIGKVSIPFYISKASIRIEAR